LKSVELSERSFSWRGWELEFGKDSCRELKDLEPG